MCNTPFHSRLASQGPIPTSSLPIPSCTQGMEQTAHIKRHRTQPMLQASSCLNCAYQVAPEGAAAHGFGAYQFTSQTTMLQVSSSLSCAGINQCCWQKALPLTGSVHIKLHRAQPVLQASSCLNCGVSKASNSLTEASGRDAMLPRFLLGRTPRLPRFARA